MAATRLPEVDAVLLGVGLVGTILGRELTRAGLKVVGLERGEPRTTVPDFQGPAMHDELRYSVRKALMQDSARETLTFRNNAQQTALPLRRFEGFLPGTGLGGAAVHWNGQTYRFQDSDFQLRTKTQQRYGQNFIPADLSVQDWGVTAADLEPHYDRFEYLMGTSGKAGNLKGQKVAGGNPFEDPRSREYPTPPQKEPYGAAMFRKAAAGLGYHPFPQPSCNLSQPYTNPEGMRMNACMFCGYCERFGCEHFAKSSPQTVLLPVLLKDPHFTLRTQCQVLRINLDSTKKRATGVVYADGAGREFEQPAKLVIVGMFALNNVRMLLLSGIGAPYDPQSRRGVVGRNYAYQTTSGVQVFFDENVNINPLPLLRMTFDFPPNDLKMSEYVTARATDIARAMGGRQVAGGPRKGPYTTTQYQSTHNTGGTVMGNDPSTSAVNRFLQSWDVHNVFVIGASNFPQNASYNPTDTVGALAYWAADGIVNRYLKAPGPLAS